MSEKTHDFEFVDGVAEGVVDFAVTAGICKHMHDGFHAVVSFKTTCTAAVGTFGNTMVVLFVCGKFHYIVPGE